MDELPVAESESVRFRPSKKRKVYRQRDSLSDHNEPAPQGDSAEAAQLEDGDTHAMPVARLRTARRHRGGGVGFTTLHKSEPTDQSLAAAGPPQDSSRAAAAVVHGTADRFTQERSVISSFDSKHMTQFIESRLSRRAEPPEAHDEARNPHPLAAASSPQQQPARVSSSGLEDDQKRKAQYQQPAAHGQLVEVDLDALPVRPQGRHAAPEKKKAPRLGPDGKPWRGGRKRRGSDDIKRDQLVEEFLHENRLDVYDTTSGKEAAVDDRGLDAGTADDRLAEQFKKQYLDDVARRRQKKKKPAQPTGRAAAANEDVLKGPKLGGSRNARAAVRNALLQKEKEARK